MQDATKLLKSHNKFHITLGLERIEKILNLLDNPQNKYKVIHVAGTNGKGSTSKIINDILIESNKKTGLYTSPHIFSYEERIKVNNENISNYIFNKLIYEIDKLATKNNIELSEFELLTAVGFYYFYIRNVEYAVIETGLGGLFDATNVVKKPLVEVITTIDFDHTERLGSTIDEIATQKAGIIKQNSKVVISKNNSGFNVIKQTALEKNAKIIDPVNVKVEFNDNKNYAIYNNEKMIFNLLGSYQAQNLGLALGAVDNLDFEITKKAVQNALKKVSWSYRTEYDKNKNLIIDSSHNPSGTKVLKEFLDENFAGVKKTFIFGCLKNKDYKQMLEILLDEDDEFYFMEFDYPNALKFEELDEKYKLRAEKIIDLKDLPKNDNLKIISGSIYMLGQIMKK